MSGWRAGVCVRATALKRLGELGILNWVRRCAESWRDGRFVLEQETNAYAVLPESQWRSYRPPQDCRRRAPGRSYADAGRAGPGGGRNGRPRRAPLWQADDAIARMRQLLGALPDGSPLTAFLPEVDGADPGRSLRSRVAISSTLVAGLELVRTGPVALDQDAPWISIRVKHGVAASGIMP